MRNRFSCLLAFVFVFCLCTPLLAQSKVAVINLGKLIELHPNTARDKAVLEATLKDFAAQRDQLKAEVMLKRKEFEEAARAVDNPALSDKARAEAKANLLAKRDIALEAEKNTTEKVRDLQKQLTEQEIRMLKITSDEIRDATKAYAKKHGIDVVLQGPDPKHQIVSSVFYSNPAVDITKPIMDLLGIKEPPAEVPSDDKADAKATK